MLLEERINALAYLGNYLRNVTGNCEWKENIDFKNVIEESFFRNGWFDEQHVLNALRVISSWLEKDTLQQFITPYSFPESGSPSKNIGLLMAGNIPLVGFHDFLCVFLSGQRSCIKLAGNDAVLLPFLLLKMEEKFPQFKNYYVFTEKLSGIDAVIATGSNNSARYFEAYFGKLPHIFRKNRNSMAVLNGNENEATLEKLAHDIFLYYGLGCRSVSLLWLPKGFDTNKLFTAFTKEYAHFSRHKKYMNNYDYYRTVFLLNKIPFIENNLCILRNERSLHSPVAVINITSYESLSEIEVFIQENQEGIQCIVGSENTLSNTLYGESQNTNINNFADNINTCRFLQENLFSKASFG